MDLARALDRVGLEPAASEEEVRRAWRSVRARLALPGGGDSPRAEWLSVERALRESLVGSLSAPLSWTPSWSLRERHASEPAGARFLPPWRAPRSASLSAPLAPTSSARTSAGGASSGLEPGAAQEHALEAAAALAAFLRARGPGLIAAPRERDAEAHPLESAAPGEGCLQAEPPSARAALVTRPQPQPAALALARPRPRGLELARAADPACARTAGALPPRARRAWQGRGLRQVAGLALLGALVGFFAWRAGSPAAPAARLALEAVAQGAPDELGIWHVREDALLVRGQLSDARPAATIAVRDRSGALVQRVQPDARGAFELRLAASEAGSLYEFRIDDREAGREQLRVERDPRAPLIVKTSPASEQPSSAESVDLEVWVQEEHLVLLELDGEPLRREADGHFVAAGLRLPPHGRRSFRLEASDSAGNRTSRSISLERDARAPRLLDASPADASVVEADVALELVLCFDEFVEAVRLDGAPLSIDPDARTARGVRRFARPAALELAWSARDRAGNEGRGVLHLDCREVVRLELDALALADPIDGVRYTSAAELALSGRVRAARADWIAALDGQGRVRQRAALDESGRFAFALELPPEELFEWCLQTPGLAPTPVQRCLRDASAPSLVWLEPDPGRALAAELVAAGRVDLRVRLAERNPDWLRCGAIEFERARGEDEEWIARAVPIPADGRLRLEAADLAGRLTRAEWALDIDRVAPHLIVCLAPAERSAAAPERAGELLALDFRGGTDGDFGADLGEDHRGGPAADGLSAELRLRFDEPLASFALGAHELESARLAAAVGVGFAIPLQAAGSTPELSLPWRALDRFGNESAGQLELPAGWTLDTRALAGGDESVFGELAPELRAAYLVLEGPASAGAQRRLPRRLLQRLTGIEFRLVPAGRFGLGDERSASEDEGPEQAVELSAFYMARHEVSRQVWSRGGGASSGSTRADYPVTNLSWYEADAWCRALGLRLPSEAQWEYAAAGSEERRFPWGDEWRARACNAGSAGEDDFEGSAPVGSFAQDLSWCGLLDMAGNVSEWCSDTYRPYAEWVRPGALDPRQSEGEERYVERGGCFADENPTRNSYRFGYSAEGTEQLGFRPVLLP